MKKNKKYKIDLKPVGLRLKEVRQSLLLSQDQLGEKVQLSKTTICDYEVGKTPPGFDFLFKLSGMFGINLEYIFSGEGPIFKDKSQLPNTTPGEKMFGDFDREVGDILDYMKKSHMVLLAVVTMATEYINKNKELIDSSINLEKAKKEEKKSAAARKRGVPGNALVEEDIDGKI
jgi:DNA-binding XRE family transcriptional regulator